MEELVANLKLAMADRIRTNSWMAPSTKEAALAKLDKMDVMVGYPDKRSEEHTSELQSLMRNSYAVFCLTKKRAERHISQHKTSSKENIPRTQTEQNAVTMRWFQ